MRLVMVADKNEAIWWSIPIPITSLYHMLAFLRTFDTQKREFPLLSRELER
jgi:hypothetical protein